MATNRKTEEEDDQMACKDCIHYEVCELYSKRESIATLYCAKECPFFTDKSEWLHMPREFNITV